MIVSASIHADIPADHGAWFMRRIDVGYCRVARAEGLRYPHVSLTPEAVDGFVFWTRRVEPFLPCLAELRRRHYAFTVQFAITGDPACSRIAAELAVQQFRKLRDEFGARVGIWRYDPLVLTADRPPEWHAANFGRLAAALAGITDEAVIAFPSNPSGPTRPSRVPTLGEYERQQRRALVKHLVQVASSHDMRLTLCAQPDTLVPGASPSRCIDARRLADIAGRPLDAPRGGFHSGCLCSFAVDVGDHDSAQAPVFCGVRLQRRRRRASCPDDEFLFPPVPRLAPARAGDLPF